MIKLTCTNCGGKLELKPETEQFACGYCGTEFLVERGGGIVSLKRVEEGLDKVVANTGEIIRQMKVARSDESIIQEETLRAQTRLMEYGKAQLQGFVVLFALTVLTWIGYTLWNVISNNDAIVPQLIVSIPMVMLMVAVYNIRITGQVKPQIPLIVLAVLIFALFLWFDKDFSNTFGENLMFNDNFFYFVLPVFLILFGLMFKDWKNQKSKVASK